MASRKRYGKSFAELLAEARLPEIKKLMEEIYGGGIRLHTSIYMFVSRPLVELLGAKVDPRDITDLIVREEWDRIYKILGIGKEARTLSALQLDAYRQLIVCSYVVEEVAARAYNLIAEKSRDPITSIVARYIGEESRLHAEVIKTLSSLGSTSTSLERLDEALQACQDPGAQEFVKFYESMKKSLEDNDVDEDKVAQYLMLLADMEKVIGEEKYEEALLPLLGNIFSEREYADVVSLLIDAIVKDEEYHEQLARTVAKYIKLIKRD